MVSKYLTEVKGAYNIIKMQKAAIDQVQIHNYVFPYPVFQNCQSKVRSPVTVLFG